MPLTTEQLDQVERLCNAAIHELVFVDQHAGQADYDDALTCLVQVQQNAETMAEMLLKAQNEKEASQ
jgi:hypothetical protein